MPFGFCHEMIKGFVVTGACWTQGTRLHSAGLFCLTLCGQKGAFLMKTPLRDLSGELCFGVSHLRPLQNISSALYSSKDPWIYHHVRTKTNAAEGSSRKMNLADNGAWIRKICTHIYTACCLNCAVSVLVGRWMFLDLKILPLSIQINVSSSW